MANTKAIARGSVKLRVLELFSGIGGWHCGLEESGVSYEVVMAADVNTTANEIYKSNFPETKITNRSIQAIGVKDFEKLNVDMIVMSPPCQPFTRVGLQKDTEDVRTQPFLHILKVLESLQNLPQYLLLENVKGFDVSQARELLVQTMEKCGYTYQEFLLSPLQFGVPNARLRYYFLAKKKPLSFGFSTKREIWEELPECVEPFLKYRVKCDEDKSGCKQTWKEIEEQAIITESENVGWMGRCKNCCEILHTSSDKSIQNVGIMPVLSEEQTAKTREQVTSCSCDHELSVEKDGAGSRLDFENSLDSSEEKEGLLAHELVEKDLWKYTRHCQTLLHYLEPREESYFEEYLVPDEKLKRLAVMDLVKPTDRKCICFTKSYGHHMNGTGSVLQQGPDPSPGVNLHVKDFSELQWKSAKELKLRFFTPRELAGIMSFPPTYGFPKNFNKRQCYRVLGNSLNVHVCSTLIKLLVMPEISS